MKVYDFKVKDTQGSEVSLKNYEGKVLLIVNTATECGFTPQYKELQDIYKEYAKEGFEILDFPCNQFANQAPGSDEEISSFCSLRFGTTFPRFSKIDVNGEQAIPLYQYLVSEKGFQGFDPNHKLTPVLDEILSKANPDYRNQPDIKWNFTKFLIDRSGNVIARFEPMEDMHHVEEMIREAL